MKKLHKLAKDHLSFLCEDIENRCVGSKGNLYATAYFSEQLNNNNWHVESQEFEAFDWNSEFAIIETEGLKLRAISSPYSMPCDVVSEPVIVSTIEELEVVDAEQKILIVMGDLTSEQLMPKNFVFYNPEHHQKMVSLLESSKAAALIFIVGKSGFYEGGEYPFPIVEDGDFLIPSVFISEEDGANLLDNLNGKIRVISKTTRTPSKGFNIIGTKGSKHGKKIVVTAHIDAKKGSPGAIDNATGVTVLLLISELLKEYRGDYLLELVAFNGEDYYSVPGQMTYIQHNKDKFDEIMLNINVDGVGLSQGKTSYALMQTPEAITLAAQEAFRKFPGFVEGKPWVQGDHSIFLQYGIPAIAITSEWLLENLMVQRITHTENDSLKVVDVDKITELAKAISTLILEV